MNSTIAALEPIGTTLSPSTAATARGAGVGGELSTGALSPSGRASPGLATQLVATVLSQLAIWRCRTASMGGEDKA